VATDRQPRPAGLDEQIDQLYQAPLAEFTAGRNALAKTLKGADAQRVKRLAKPTLIPWTINQVYWTARSVYDHLLEAGAALRRAQIAALEKPGTTAARMQRSRDQVREAVEAHRKAVADAVHQGVRVAARSGAHPPADGLTRMLESLSLAAAQPGNPGRFSEVVQPAGFEALTGVTPTFSLDVPPPSSHPSRSPDPATSGAENDDAEDQSSGERQPPRDSQRAKAASKREAAAAERERQKVLTIARHALAQARQSEARARARADQAAAAVVDAERALEQARQAQLGAQSQLEASERARQTAEDEVKEIGAR
jgi:hypothetical protein